MADTEIIKALDILDKFNFFGGQRAGRELWNDKPLEVQDIDIENFAEDVQFLKDLIQRQQKKIDELKELQRYKALEEAGRLIELPCKVGDTVHFITTDGRILNTTLGDLNTVYRFKDLIGKVFYLTKAEAERKLAELKGGAE